MTVAITCAGCRRTLRVPGDQIGQTVRCPLCIESFVAEADPNQPPPLAEKATPRKRVVVAELAHDASEDVVVATLESDAAPAAEPQTDLPTRPTKPFKTVSFGLLFFHDPDRLLRGRVEAELTLDGLRVRLRSRHALYVPVLGPHPARYLGGNRLAVFLDGREVTVALVKARTDLNRLARDVAAFLNGRRAEVNGRAYALPWKLTLLPWLALAVPFLAIWLRVLGGVHGGGRFLWFLVAGIAVLCGIKYMRRESLSTGRRAAVAGMAVGCCFLLLASAFAYRLLHPNTVPSQAWRPFDPPGQRCRILMPGVPMQGVHVVAGINNTVIHTITVYEVEKTFTLGIGSLGPLDRNQVGGWGEGGRMEKCRHALEREVLGYRSGKSQTVVLKSGEVGVQLEMALTGYNGRGQHGTQISQLFIAGDQLFTLSVIGEDVDADDPDVKKFFGSFQLGAAVAPPSPESLTGVAAYWSFEDLTTNKPAGTQYLDVEPTVGVRGRGAALNGGGAYVNLDGHRDELNFGANEPFSFVGWVKPQINEPRAYILSMNEGSLDKTLLELSLENGNLVAVVRPRTGFDEFAAATRMQGQAPLLNDGRWHHVGLTRTADGKFTLFADGNPVITHKDVRLAGEFRTTVRSLGCRRFAALNEQEWTLVGALDEVAFFKRCLSAQEVARLFRSE